MVKYKIQRRQEESHGVRYIFMPNTYLRKLVELGGMEISNGEKRNWEDYVAYGSDIDGHIIAFARRT